MKLFEKLMRRFGYVKLSKQKDFESLDNNIEVYDDNVRVNISYKNPYDAIQSLKAGEMHFIIFNHLFNNRKKTMNWLDMKYNNLEEISPYDVVDHIFDNFHQEVDRMNITDLFK